MEQSLMRFVWVFIGSLLAGMAWAWVEHAIGAEMCAPTENPYVCAVIEERNNSLDELAKAEGGRRLIVRQQEAERDWWGKYVAGINEQREVMSLWLSQYIKGIEEQRQQAATDAATMAARAAEAGKRGGR